MTVQESLREVKEATTEKWESFKLSMESDWQALRGGLNRTTAKFQ